jgi:hypothetical protein
VVAREANTIGARFFVGWLLTAAAIAAHAATPHRVLMLHSFGPEFGDLYAKDMRLQLCRQMPGHLEIYEEWLLSGEWGSPSPKR